MKARVDLNAVDRALEPFDKLTAVHPDEAVRGALRLARDRSRAMCDADRRLVREVAIDRVAAIRTDDEWSPDRRAAEVDACLADQSHAADRRVSSIAGATQPRCGPERHAADGGERAARPRANEQPVLLPLDTVQPERVRWLWPGRIPIGKLSVVDGDPGLGKSLITLDLAARVSIGAAMPDGMATDLGGPAGVVLLSAEDDPADTIRPRLDAAGADVARIAALTAICTGSRERMPSLDALGMIEQAIAQTGARLVVVDPLMAYLPTATDSHRDQDIRSLLAPLGQLAARSAVAIVIVRHLNKRSGGNPLYRGGGSIGIVGAARSGLLVAHDPDDADGQRRILAVTKSNLSAEAPALAYRVDSAGGVPRIRWEGPTQHTATQLVAEGASDGEGRGALAEAREWLSDILADGPQPAKEIQRAAREAGISDITLRRAREAIASVMRLGGGTGQRWLWALKRTPNEMLSEKLTGDARLTLSISQPHEPIGVNEQDRSEMLGAARVEHLSSKADNADHECGLDPSEAIL